MVKEMKLIERKDYLNKITSVMGTPDIKEEAFTMNAK